MPLTFGAQMRPGGARNSPLWLEPVIPPLISSLWMTAAKFNFTSYMGDTPPQFANRSEEECARILDYYRIPWMYEPRTFVLERDVQGSVIEAFTPDFYLPEQDLFVELTTMKQAHVTKKNMKIRKVRERFPEINIKLFYKKDFLKLAQKFDIAAEEEHGR